MAVSFKGAHFSPEIILTSNRSAKSKWTLLGRTVSEM